MGIAKPRRMRDHRSCGGSSEATEDEDVSSDGLMAESSPWGMKGGPPGAALADVPSRLSTGAGPSMVAHPARARVAARASSLYFFI